MEADEQRDRSWLVFLTCFLWFLCQEQKQKQRREGT